MAVQNASVDQAVQTAGLLKTVNNSASYAVMTTYSSLKRLGSA